LFSLALGLVLLGYDIRPAADGPGFEPNGPPVVLQVGISNGRWYGPVGGGLEDDSLDGLPQPVEGVAGRLAGQRVARPGRIGRQDFST
jgi:hypothetical protein